MFGRSRRQRPSTRPAETNVVPEIGLTALPDYTSIARQQSLTGTIGATLRGYSGTAIGYDRGDPAMSFEGVLPGPLASPTAAMARIGRVADAAKMAPPAEITDIVMSDPALDPYQALLYQRIAR